MLRISTILSTLDRNHPRPGILRAGLTALASFSLLLPAYGMSTTAAVQEAAAVPGATLSGHVDSGQTPVVGAIVALFAAGAKGYGSEPSLLDLGISDGNGHFQLFGRYKCPVAPKDQVYLVAFGGDSGAGYNLNSSLATGLGTCSTLAPSASVVINEVTTVAAAYALSPFITTAPAVGTSATNYQGLVSAFKTITNLTNTTTGQALTVTPAYASNPVPSLNTSTVPQSRINTLADILEPCVHSSGASSAACVALFAAATPVGGTAPTNTLQAAVNIAQNPGSNVAALYALSTLSAPFQPSLTVAPKDWQVAITYTGAGLGIAPGQPVGDIQNTAMAIDPTGNVLVTAYGLNGGNLVPNSSMLAKFDNLGTPITPPTTQPTPTTVVYGGYLTSPIKIVLPAAISIDETGNAWISSLDNTFIDAISPALTPVFSGPINTGQLGPVEYFAINAAGDAWTAGNPNSGAFGEYSPSGMLLSPSTGYTGGGTYGNNYYGTLIQPAFDSTGAHIWASDREFGDFYRVDASTGQLSFDYFPSGGQPTSLVAGASGNIYGCPTGKAAIDVFNASSNTIVATYPTATGRGCGSQMTVDGLGKIWVISSVLDEYSSTGVLLSPLTGYTATSSVEAPTFPNPIATAVDESGNLWVLNASTGQFSTNPNNVLVEIVGTAAPVVTPLSLSLADGKVAMRP